MEIRDTPLAVADAFAAAWNDYDAEALAGLFVEDAEFVNVVGVWGPDREHIRQAHAYGFRKIFRNSHMKLGRTAVRDLGADVAVVHATWAPTGQELPANWVRGQPRAPVSCTAQLRAWGRW